MNETIEEAKRVAELAEGATGIMIKVSLLTSLITTIESQNEEIDKLLKHIRIENEEMLDCILRDQRERHELFTLIESQKDITELKNEEIQGLKNVIEREQHYANTLDADLKKQTSITELAVKGLGEIKMMLDMDHSGFQKYQIWKSAFDTLSEIERLSRERS